LLYAFFDHFLDVHLNEKKGKAKGCSSVSPAASARFLERSILTLDPFYSLDLFGDALSVLQFYMWCAQHICLLLQFLGSRAFCFSGPFLRFPLSLVLRLELSAFSPRICTVALPKELRYCDSKISTVVVLIPLWLRFEDFHCCCSYSLVVFMFLLSSLADFDRLLLCFGPVVVAHLNSFRSRGINLGFFCCFDRSSCLCCGIRFGCVAFNRFIHEISLVDMLFGLIQLVPALFGCVACSVLCSCCSVV